MSCQTPLSNRGVSLVEAPVREEPHSPWGVELDFDAAMPDGFSRRRATPIRGPLVGADADVIADVVVDADVVVVVDVARTGG